ncbi:MAG: hypothetical protein KF901_20645 [Myxococcales bacterium]|nr:hypothetical protein [Myxococcales bacterium]
MRGEHANLDEGTLVVRCIERDAAAWEELRRRHDRLVRVVIVRVLDERRASEALLDEVPTIVERIWDRLRRNDGAVLRLWNGGRLAPYLAVLTRQEAERHVEDETPAAPLMAHLPTPLHLTRDPTVADGGAAKLEEVLARLEPRAGAMVRLRQRGLGLGEIAATLGQPRTTVRDDLDQLAARLARAHGGDTAPPAWSVLLDSATVPTRVDVALRTEDEGAFRRMRTLVEASWRRLRERILLERVGWTPGPLQDPQHLAAFVDGSSRGAGRAKAEGHLTTCRRSVDSVAMLVMDLRASSLLRSAATLDDDAALAAACLVTARFRAASVLAARAAEAGSTKAPAIARLAFVGSGLQTGGPFDQQQEPSTVRRSSLVPSDDEAPLVALEALLAGEPTTAYRAIDDHAAKQTVGIRLRLLAAASGPDLPEARRMALPLADPSGTDPGLLDDALAVLALPEHRPLPGEVLAERLRDVLRDAVRLVITSS